MTATLVLGGMTLESARADSLWKLSTPQDAAGAQRPALMQVADFARSDPAIVGLMFRCGAKSIETVIVLLDPLPPRTTGTITIKAGTDQRMLDATTIITGAGLVATFDPTGPAATRWQHQHDLLVEVAADGKTSKAVLDLDGLPEGLDSLRRICAAPASAAP